MDHYPWVSLDDRKAATWRTAWGFGPRPGRGRWTVIDEDHRTVAPVEAWLEAHRQLWSPNTVRGVTSIFDDI